METSDETTHRKGESIQDKGETRTGGSLYHALTTFPFAMMSGNPWQYSLMTASSSFGENAIGAVCVTSDSALPIVKGEAPRC